MILIFSNVNNVGEVQPELALIRQCSIAVPSVVGSIIASVI